MLFAFYVCRVGAHPRSRGEHASNAEFTAPTTGSSPLARGTLALPWLLVRGLGLTPARAGNTTVFDIYSQNDRAHPRSRGEHRLPLNTVYEDMGSSPLARGTLVKSAMKNDDSGLIPARAGNTLGCPAR